MQVTPSGGQIWNQYASSASGWQNWQPMQVAPSGGQIATNSRSFTEINFKLFLLRDLLKLWTQYPGSVVPLAMFYQNVVCIGLISDSVR